ncbi:rhodanese-like domain-containing protein [Thalassomonas actiniarum]|uniref:Rhodanese-like domain-containing protein n=1 Tax=Thalassomonas actiniarum TaxID=485447 RepID=A0AAE9YU23_9GAMM|nr:rhodanese-like domain-containing protein [Thalassomonas actiniarum]WDD99497.1 rhodanese-like domain-containing protein [Thalassomonas actiniarum]
MEQLIAFAGNHPMLSMIWLILVILLIGTSIKMKLSPIKAITPQELTFLVNREDGVVVDIRTEKEFKTSHILDSINLSNEKISNNDFVSLEKHKDKPIIVVCAAGMTAGKVANQLLKAGFSKVSLLKGGMGAWSGAGLPVAKGK